MIAIILPVNRLHTRLAGGQAKSRQGAQVCLWSCEASPLMNRQSLFRRSSALEIENGSARNLLQPGTDQENALRGDDPPVVVIGEPKLTFNLGVDRAATCDEVWLAAHLSSGHNGRENDARFPKLCRRFVSACSECDRMARLPYWWSYCAGRRRGDPVEGGGIALDCSRPRLGKNSCALSHGPILFAFSSLQTAWERKNRGGFRSVRPVAEFRRVFAQSPGPKAEVPRLQRHESVFSWVDSERALATFSRQIP
jgi:hypothetical protein